MEKTLQNSLRNKMVAIQLRYLPSGCTFRYDKKWWYRVIPDEYSSDNAVTATQETELIMKKFPLHTLIATHIDEVPKSVITFGRMVY